MLARGMRLRDQVAVLLDVGLQPRDAVLHLFSKMGEEWRVNGRVDGGRVGGGYVGCVSGMGLRVRIFLCVPAFSHLF